MGIIQVATCPVCGSASIEKKLVAEDYTVSHQVFEIWQCAACSLRFTQNTPDPESIGNFYQSDAYISHTDTSEGFINKLYHTVRRKTLQRKLRLVEKATALQKGTLLDIGAGTGAFANAAQSAGWDTTGLEPDADTRERAAALYKINLQAADMLFREAPGSFDAITLWHVLEHVHDLHEYMTQIKKLLKDRGRLLIAVPNYTSHDATVYQQYWAAYDVPRHLYHFSPAAVEKLLQLHGLELLALKPMWYDSFYISMLSEQYKNGKNNLVKAVFNGVSSNITALFNRRRCSSVIYIVGKKQ